VETPVRLRERGPSLNDLRIAAFERELGHRLPNHYRAFLLAYNGGIPAVSWFVPYGKDAANTTGHATLRRFFSLPTAPEADDVPEYQRLLTPREHPSGLPGDVLVIGDDDGGAYFVIRLAGRASGQILFLDIPADTATTVANDMLDWLMRFRTVERQAELDREEWEAQRVALERGPLPAALVQQIARAGLDRSLVEGAIRQAYLDVFEDKGHVALLADPKSHVAFDLACWLLSASRQSSGVRREDMHKAMFAWCRDRDGGFGLRGFGPGDVDRWWDQRLAEGHLERANEGRMRLNERYVEGLLSKLR